MADKVVDNITKFLHGLLIVENLSNLKVKQQNLEKGKQFPGAEGGKMRLLVHKGGKRRLPGAHDKEVKGVYQALTTRG